MIKILVCDDKDTVAKIFEREIRKVASELGLEYETNTLPDSNQAIEAGF